MEGFGNCQVCSSQGGRMIGIIVLDSALVQSKLAPIGGRISLDFMLGITWFEHGAMETNNHNEE